MKIPKYIKEMVTERRRAQARSNALQIRLEEYFDKHGIDVDWRDTHIALYTEELATETMYLEAIRKAEEE